MATTDDSIKKNISQNITKYREQAGLSQKEFANRLKITPSRVSNWEQGANCPTIDMIFEICGILNVSINDIYGVYPNSNVKLTYAEKRHLEKYRFISEHSPAGAETVNYILNREYDVANQLVANQLKEEQFTYIDPEGQQNLRPLQYYRRIASAGTGQVVFEDMPTERIDIPDIPEYRCVSYAIGVNGDSMEPLYYDGDILLIETTLQIEVGQIGIFIVDGEAFVKQLGEGKLVSLNDKYKDIPLTEYSNCMGRVVGKLEEQ